MYDQWARAIAAGHGLGQAPFTQAPFFPLILGATYALLGPDPVRALWAHLLPGALTVLWVAWSAALLFGRRAAWVSGVLSALVKPAIFFTGVLLPSTWATCLAAATFWLASIAWCSAGTQGESGTATRGARGPRRIGAGTIAALGFVSAMLVLAQPTALGLALPLLASLVWTWRTESVSASGTPPERGVDAPKGRTLLLVASFLLPLAAVLLYNGAAGAWSPIAVNRGINLYIGNGPEANGAYVRPPGVREDRDLLGRAAAESALRARGEWPVGAAASNPLPVAMADRYWTDQALRAIAREPLRAAGLYVQKIGIVIAQKEVPQVESLRFESRYSRLLRLPLPGMALLLSLAAIGIVLRFGDVRARGIALAWFGGAAAIAVFFVTARFRLVLVPPLALLAGAGASDVFRAPRPRAALALVVGAATLALSLLGARAIDTRVSDGQYLFRLGVLAEQSKDLAGAKARYLEALAVDPTLGKAEVNLGTLLGREGRFDEAREHLERGVSLDPQSAIGRVSLGQLAQIRGEKERAFELFSEARSIDAELVSAAEGVLYVGYELGRLEQTAAIAREIARTASPESPAGSRARSLLAILEARASLADSGWQESAALRAADLLAVRGRLEEALAQYRALADDPSAAHAAAITIGTLEGRAR